MGREIRRVPMDWEHPKNERGHYQPMYDQTYKEASEKWVKDMLEHQALPDDEYPKTEYPYYWDYDGNPPDAEYYRHREWTDEEAVGYQIYETVSEGTPTSPIFANLDDMVKWLIGEGYSESAAANFAKGGWAPSMVVDMGKGTIKAGIESLSD